MYLKEAFEIVQEAASRSLSRIYSHSQGRNVGILTAHRGENSPQENKSRNEALKKDIKAHGYGYVHVRGRYVENKGEPNEKHVEEHSFMLIGHKGDDKGKLKGFLSKHGEKYGQDSVLYKPHNARNAHLIGTRDGGWMKKGETMDVGEFHPNKIGDYHSALKKGPPRDTKGGYSVLDHKGDEVQKFNNGKDARNHLTTGLKSGSLPKGSRVRYNARTFTNEDIEFVEESYV